MIRLEKRTVITKCGVLLHQTDFEVGDRVWLFTPRAVPDLSRKLTTYWTGPWRILEKLNELTYRLSPQAEWGYRKTFQDAKIDRLLPFHAYDEGRPVHVPPDPIVDLDMPGDAFAECIDDDVAGDNIDHIPAVSPAVGGGGFGTSTPRPPGPSAAAPFTPHKAAGGSPSAFITPAAPTGSPPTSPSPSTRRRHSAARTLRFDLPDPTPSPPIAARTRSHDQPAPTPASDWDDYLPPLYPDSSTGAHPKDRAHARTGGGGADDDDDGDRSFDYETATEGGDADTSMEVDEAAAELEKIELASPSSAADSHRQQADWVFDWDQTLRDELYDEENEEGAGTNRSRMDEIELETDDDEEKDEREKGDELYPDLSTADTEEVREEGRRLRARSELKGPERYVPD